MVHQSMACTSKWATFSREGFFKQVSLGLGGHIIHQIDGNFNTVDLIKSVFKCAKPQTLTSGSLSAP